MANQVQVTTTGNIVVQVAPPPNVNVTVSRTAIGQISNVPSANYANFANVANIANVANVANSVNVSNVVGIGNIAVLNIDGNAGNILYGNGVFATAPNAQYANNANYANFAGTAFNVSGSNVTGAVANANYATLAGNVTGSVANANYASYAGEAFNVSGANVVGQVANANYAGLSGSALSIAGANVSGQVANANFATTAGTAISVPGANISGSVANATHANVADVANSVAGSNVSGAVAYASVANSVAGANVSGEVAYANVANNVAGANVSGTVANATYANIAGVAYSVAGANVSGTVANANYATYSGTSFNVSGSNVVGYVSDASHANVADVANSVAGANVSGYVANASHANIADVANSVAGANVTGQVANALVAGTVYTANQPNITSIGTLSSLSVSGNSNIGQLNISGNATATGNITASYFLGNIIGNISGNLVVPGTNTSVLYNDDGNAGASSNFTFNEATNVVTIIGNIQANYFIGDGSQLSNINGSNISNVGNANYANYAGTAYSVSGGNVSGQVANALVAGTVYTNAQPNITSVGNLTSLTVTGNATIGNIVSVDSVTFDTANVGPGAVAQFTWNDGDGTLDLGLKGGNVTLQVGEQLFARVHNNEATALVKGEVVYVVGASGNRIAVSRAQANAEATSSGTLGFIAETISAGGEGFVITAGALYKLNTLGQTPGATVYLSPSIAGGYTTTKPVAPDQLVILGWIERVSATVGSIYVKVDNGYELDELHNVLISNAQTGQALVYNSSNLWVNGIPNIANVAYSVAGANVSGDVANANHANIADAANIAYSVSGANVSGDVAGANHANVADTANNIAGANISGEVANANYATYAGTAYSISGSNIVGEVANANYATFAGTAYSVSGSNVTSEVANANFATYAGTAYSVDAANVSGLGNVALVNFDGNASNALLGNGVFGMVSSVTVAGANTEVQYNNNGNLGASNTFTFNNTTNTLGVNNFIASDVANTRSPNIAINPSGVTYGNSPNGLSDIIITDYGSQSSNANPMNITFIKARGNSTNMTGANNNDQMMRLDNKVYNGNTYPRAVVINTSAPNAATYSNSSVTWTPGIFGISTGNPNGNLISNAATGSFQNTLTFDQYGRINITQGTYNPVSPTIINATVFGSNSDGSGQSGTIQVTRARGNRDGQLPVDGNDGIGGFQFYANTGTSVINSGAIQANVNTSYGAITSGKTAPTDITIKVTDNSNNAYETTFRGNGIVTFPGNIYANYLIGNISGANVIGEVANANYATYAGTAYSVSGANVSGEVANANYATYAGTAYSVSGANVSGEVANANYATYAGTAYSVDGANVSGEVANANYATYAGTAYSVDAANVVGLGNVALANFDGNSSNALLGNGIFGTMLAGTNTQIQYNDNGNMGASANLTFDNTTNTFTTTNANLNGNLIINAGVTYPTVTVNPVGIVAGPTGNNNRQPNSYVLFNEYGNGQGDGNATLTKSITFTKFRGNATTPTTAATNDRIGRVNFNAYNGSANTFVASTQTVVTNMNSNANAYYSGGQYQISTGNPSGDWGNANALSGLNTFAIDQYGRLVITQGSANNNTGKIGTVVTTYGQFANGAGQGGSYYIQRARGNRDSNQPVQNTDGVGGIYFAPYNGNTFFSTTSGMQGVVDTTYGAIANGSPVPVKLEFLTQSPTYGNIVTTFLPDGNIQLGSANSKINYPNGSPWTSVPNQLVLIPDTNGAPSISINGNSANGNTGTLNLFDSGLNVNINKDTYPGGSPSFAFQIYGTGSSIPPQFYKRYDGTYSSPSGVINGDQILNQYYQVYGDSGNTNMTIGGITGSVGNVTGPGNISFNYQIYGSGNNEDRIDLTFPNVYLNGNVTVSTGKTLYTDSNVTVGNLIVTSPGTITYDRTYGEFCYANTAGFGFAAANTIYTMPLDTTTLNNNVTISGTGNVNINKSGTYKLIISLQAASSNNTPQSFDFWLRKDGTDVTNSKTQIDLLKDQKSVIAMDWMVQSNGSNYFQIVYATASAGYASITFPTVAANSPAGYTSPLAPALIVNVIPVGA